MRLILILFLFFTLLYSQEISEKLIVSGHKTMKETQAELMKLKKVFDKNEKSRELQKIHHLTLEIETLGDYSMVVIHPIRSLALKNELLLFLSPMFPEVFAIKEQPKKIKSIAKKQKKLTTVPVTHQRASFQKGENKVQNWVDEIGLQWIALLLLSIIGLFLSVNSRSKMASLEKTQDALSLKQAQMENEIKNLGATGV